MRVSGGIGSTYFFFRWSLYTKRKAIGISSLYPENPEWHYGIFDIDTQEERERVETYLMKWYGRIDFAYETKKGLHYMVFSPNPFILTASIILGCPDIDLSWFAIGLKRGYWFIENYSPIPKKLRLKYPIHYMKIDRIS